MSCSTWRLPELKDQALQDRFGMGSMGLCLSVEQETGYLLTAFLDPEAPSSLAPSRGFLPFPRSAPLQALGTLSCVSRTWAGPASSFDWAGGCQVGSSTK